MGEEALCLRTAVALYLVLVNAVRAKSYDQSVVDIISKYDTSSDAYVDMTSSGGQNSKTNLTNRGRWIQAEGTRTISG